ncbi:MinD/ParA family ATP-binding protein [Streptomyces sp. NPDC002851]
MVGSLTGSPGVTTTALALTAAWPVEMDGGVRPVMVEADASGGDLMIRFGLDASPSLLDVAVAAGKPDPGSLLGAVRELPPGVRVVVSPPGRGPCREAVRLLAAVPGRRVLLGGESVPGTVIVDVGRIGPEAEPLVDAVDEVVLVSRGGAESLTHIAAGELGVELRRERLTLVVVGPCPYPGEEIAGSLGVARVVLWPWDARSAAGVSHPGRRLPRTAGWRVPPLMRAARALAVDLAERYQEEAPLPVGQGEDSADAAVADGGAEARAGLADRVRLGLVPSVDKDGGPA